MAWFSVDCDFNDHPKVVALPSDSARLGFFQVLAKAKRQPVPGTFSSDKQFVTVLGRFGRYLADYMSVGLLERAVDGSLRVHDWQDYQRDKTDRTAAERQRRYRESHATQTRDVTPLRNDSPARGRAVAVDVAVEENVELGSPRGAGAHEERPFVLLTEAEKAEHLRAEKDETIRRTMLQVGLKPELVP